MGQASPGRLGTLITVGEHARADGCPLCGEAETVIPVAGRRDLAEALRREAAQMVVIRESVPHRAALALVEEVRAAAPTTPVIVLSERPNLEEAVALVARGASDYLVVPLDEKGLTRARAALGGGQAAARPERFFTPECPPGVPFVGRSPGIREVLRSLQRVAESGCNPALLLGETGTGKELAARALHRLRGGTDSDFVAVNCATLTANLLESELFGHVKGAFTGADRDKAGLFEEAGEGTIFLDEISEMPPALQAKLLRVLQERSFRKVGGTRDIPCRATIIASSNRDLPAEVEAGRFRRDLYYRLAVFPVHLPPLRAPERRDDIPLLAEYFLTHSTLPVAPQVEGLTPEAVQRLTAHHWPGNVRELKNVVERAMILAQSGPVRAEHILLDPMSPPADPRGTPAPWTAVRLPPNDFSLETAERIFIQRALEKTGWQRTRAAALLGITRATLHAKLKRYKIRVPDSPRTSTRDQTEAEPVRSERHSLGCSRV